MSKKGIEELLRALNAEVEFKGMLAWFKAQVPFQVDGISEEEGLYLHERGLPPQLCRCEVLHYDIGEFSYELILEYNLYGTCVVKLNMAPICQQTGRTMAWVVVLDYLVNLNCLVEDGWTEKWPESLESWLREAGLR
jgi:hypothetical protein